jgi:DNA invertase Pin-like site-specific DNA recombinase
MARIGYARVRRSIRTTATQKVRLHAAGCKFVRSEKASGKSLQGRDKLASIVEFIRAEETLY